MNNLNDEEREIQMREMWRKWEQRQADINAWNEQRKAPSIGYGMLYDQDGEDDVKVYRMEVDILLPGMFAAWFDRPDPTKHPYEDIDASSLDRLTDMVEHTVKQWRMDYAPPGAKTDLVNVDLTD